MELELTNLRRRVTRQRRELRRLNRQNDALRDPHRIGSTAVGLVTLVALVLLMMGALKLGSLALGWLR